MDATQFAVPVRIDTKDGVIREIYSAEDALEVLFNWPRRQGPLYEKALETCLIATVGGETAESAQNAFRLFSRASGILAKDMMYSKDRRLSHARHI
ncbi:DUF982 domain-containing protein [Corticibacterium sp. UT-5YL-CI-8]|nr:DUF982 domain-containing protein [Tianweitania sp. UT-5YL-CI-8]